jgi:hypothetical protein
MTTPARLQVLYITNDGVIETFRVGRPNEEIRGQVIGRRIRDCTRDNNLVGDAQRLRIGLMSVDQRDAFLENPVFW